MKRKRLLRHLSAPAGYVLRAVPPRPNRVIINLGRLVSSWYVRRVMGISSITTVGIEDAARLTADQSNRVIFAFRHPTRDDPLVMVRSIGSLLHRAARRTGTPFRRLVYPVFLYARGVAVWGGPAVAWLLPRGGAISVYHQQVNRESLNAVFQEVTAGTQPMALAPEAQVTYHNERVAPIQRGTAVLAERARDVGRTVCVIPVGLRYHYPDSSRSRNLRRVLRRVERSLGVAPLEPTRDGVVAGWNALLTMLLADYRENCPNLAESLGIGDETSDQTAISAVQRKLESVRTIAFAVAEQLLDSPTRPDAVERIFEIRRRLYAQLFSRTTPWRRGLRDFRRDVWARNALVASVHLELVDLLAYLDFSYLEGTPGKDRVAEYALSLADACSRAIGHSIGRRPSWPRRTCRVEFLPPLELPDLALPFPKRVRETHARLQAAMDSLARPLSDAP